MTVTTKTPKAASLSVRIPDELLAQLRLMADEELSTPTTVARRLIVEGIRKQLEQNAA